MEPKETKRLLLKEGKTLLYFMTNGGHLHDSIYLIYDLLPKFKALYDDNPNGPNLYFGFGSSTANEIVPLSKVERSLTDGKMLELISEVDPNFGGSANNDEILKDMARLQDYQNFDNVFFFSMYNVSDICMVDINAKRWISRRCFVAVGMTDYAHADGERYFHGMRHLLYNGKVMNADRLAFLLQFAQLD